MVYNLHRFTTRVFFGRRWARRGYVGHNRAVGNQGLGLSFSGAHKPLVDGSNPFLATGANLDQQLRQSRRVVGHFLFATKGFAGSM